MQQEHPATGVQAPASSDLPLVVGVDLGGTQIRAAVLRGPALLSRISMPTGRDTAPGQVLPRMFQIVEQALTTASITLDQIAGIGIAAPGPLSGCSGIVFAPPNLAGWHDVPLRALFQEHYQKPVMLEKDTNAAALGEYLFGAGRGCDELVYVTVSTGVGGGVISGGRLLTGSSGTAGELGHITIDWHGEHCNCGNIGCLESIASGTAIAKRANRLVAMGEGEALLQFALAQQQHEQTGDDTEHSPVHITARTVAEAARAGIPEARKIIAHAAEGLGVGLVNILHIFNPQVIILGGSLTQIGAPLLEPAVRIVNERAMRVPREAFRLVLAELGADAGLVGAGALVYR
ncbi:MAG: ROK family protein [Ktedonobacteraceae bacterium]|nr:ROK family protein [Ktedonobacteraceae bacterium]